MKFRITTLLAIIFGWVGALNAQTTISGKVIDATTGEALIGANVFIEGTFDGTSTSLDGSYSFTTNAKGKQNLSVQYLGFEVQNTEINVDGASVAAPEIKLKPSAIGLQQLNVIADVAADRQAPIAFSKIPTEIVQDRIGNTEFAEVLRTTPSIYTTKSGGGAGDSRVNIRGFAQENVALLINGIPVNGMEDNKIYWSNWAGLGDVTRTIQVQRGLGLSKLAVASVGGTINIITKTTDQEKGGVITQGIGNNGFLKTALTLSTGKTEDGWAVTFSGSRTTADGYVEYTYNDAWSYFLSISKEINDKHTLLLTGFGAPQKHGQRDFQHSISDQKNLYGTRWNDDYGTYQGQDFTFRENFYHKPQFGLSHLWSPTEKTYVSTALYASIGRGGGTGDLGGIDGRGREFRQPKDQYGHQQFDQFALYNTGQANNLTDNPLQAMQYQVSGGDVETGFVASGSNGLIKRASMNEHEWYGVLSSVEQKINENLTLAGGVDVRLYHGRHYRKTIDLLGADYWFETDNINANSDWADLNGNGLIDADEIGNLVRPANDASDLFGSVPDNEKIDYFNEEDINWYGGFTQLEYKTTELTAFVSGAFNLTTMRRIDFFQKVPGEQETDWINFIGGNVKAGANYNLTAASNIFVNAGYLSRSPYFDAVFPTFNNDEANEDAKNEKVLSLEAGYGYTAPIFKVNINGYYTQWNDKREVSPAGNDLFLNLLGVDATHSGVEANVNVKVTNELSVNGFVSVGNWEWSNNPSGIINDDNNNPIDTVDLFLEGIKVGDAAQTTSGLGLEYKTNFGLSFYANHFYFDDLYASYEPADRDDEALSDEQPLKLPSYHLVDGGVKYRFTLNGLESTFVANVNNIFDHIYVAEANDTTGPLSTTRGWYGFGRTWNATLRVKF